MNVLYGNKTIAVNTHHPSIEIKYPEAASKLADWESVFNSTLHAVSEKASARKPKKICVIVEDRTRINPQYPYFLSRLYETLHSSLPDTAIYLLIAYGTHEKHSKEDNIRCYGAENLSKYILVDHDSRNPKNLKTIGTLKSGLPLKINLTAAESGLVISFGTVAPHAFAGFTGGRKIILPGISSYENICSNHSKVKQENVGLGMLDKNPIHAEMQEAAGLFSPDFCYQTVFNSRREIAGLFFGKLDEAFHEAVAFCKTINTGFIGETPDLVLASCGGEPFDSSIYFAQRTITLACQTVRQGGTAVIFGKFPNGIGDKHYEKWLSKPVDEVLNLPESAIDVMVHSAYLTAKNRARCKLYFFTDLKEEQAAGAGLNLINTKEKLESLLSSIPAGNKMLFIPNGSSLLLSRGGTQIFPD
ncbi:MAG TPA: nickel-dependent lactate racemase [Candidatus Goldiibacteriota bacterium]|nr:nickel-dependent lactate racemase [Candidatus Goldiibacteriota bacterium]HRQ44914.1 nickel-dependent lactate racemase [Candidatus Goldiibacteriota bacterium]